LLLIDKLPNMPEWVRNTWPLTRNIRNLHLCSHSATCPLLQLAVNFSARSPAAKLTRQFLMKKFPLEPQELLLAFTSRVTGAQRRNAAQARRRPSTFRGHILPPSSGLNSHRNKNEGAWRRWMFLEPYGVTSENTAHFSATAVRISHSTKCHTVCKTHTYANMPRDWVTVDGVRISNRIYQTHS
jgi:hypothetical protein